MSGVDNINDLETALNTIRTDICDLDKQIELLQTKRRVLKDAYKECESKLLAARLNNLSDPSAQTVCLSVYNQSNGFPWSAELDRVLTDLFHLSSFRPLQLKAINASMMGKDVFLIMPTGAGKSLIYQLPAFVEPSNFQGAGSNTCAPISLVISPLISLMTNQAFNLERIGLPPDSIKVFDANTSVPEKKSILDSLSGKLQFISQNNSPLRLLYITPEKLAKSKLLLMRLQSAYSMGRLGRIAIDEAHCVSQWGHDFRPDYEFLHILKRQFPSVPLICLTATASNRVIVDMQSVLGVSPANCVMFRSGYNRKNLNYQVQPVNSVGKQAIAELYELIKTRYAGKSGIVYCFSQKDVETVADGLKQHGLSAAPYHANLDADYRSRAHRRWCTDQMKVMVATVAFGMGIDKPDVGFVIHYAASKSMENYYQESGRAGRDSNPADCVLLWRFADLFRLASMVSSERTGVTKLIQMISYCLDSTSCRRQLIANNLDDTSWTKQDCQLACDNCRRREQDAAGIQMLDVTQLVKLIYSLLSERKARDERLTGPKLVELLYADAKIEALTRNLLRLQGKPDRSLYQYLVGWLLTNHVLKFDFHLTPYSTVCYIVEGNHRAMEPGLKMPYDNSTTAACDRKRTFVQPNGDSVCLKKKKTKSQTE